MLLVAHASLGVNMSKIPKDALNNAGADAISSAVKTMLGSAAIEGVLYPHADPARVNLATEASANFGVHFEVYQADIESVAVLPHPLTILGQSFKAVRVLIKLDAIVTRIGVHTLSSLLELTSLKTANATTFAKLGSVDETSAEASDDDVLKLRSTMLAPAQMR
jgi:hypothetical protein